MLPAFVCAIVALAPPPLTRDAAVLQALQSHPRLKAADLERAASRHGVDAARARPSPTLTLAPWLGSPNGTTEELLFLQPLDSSARRDARTALARSQAAADQAAFDQERLAVAHAVRVAYDALAYAQEAEALAQSAADDAAELERLTARQVELGARPGIDASQSRIESARATQRLRHAQGQRRTAQTALAALLGQPDDAPPPVAAPLPRTPAPTPDAPVARPELAAERAEAERARGEAGLLRAERRPGVALILRAQNLFHRADGSDRGGAVQISVPLDAGAGRARLRQIDAQSQAQEARVQAVALQIQQERRLARERLDAAAAVLTALPADLLERSERLVRARKTGFQAGQTDLLPVLEAQRTHRSALAEQLDAAYAYAQARTEWERAHGTLP